MTRTLPPELQALAGQVVERTLPNGLKLYCVPRPGVATVHFAMAFGVGGVDEQEGRSGVAHLYEHMAFKGTATLGTRNAAKERVLLARLDTLDEERLAESARGVHADAEKLKRLKAEFDRVEAEAESLVVPNEFDEVYARNGAKGLNAYTSKDRTVYIIALPGNRARLWAAMEGARVKGPVLRQFYRERNVVLEELRRYDDIPSWRMYDALSSLAFPAHPYRTPIIGWKSELEKLTRRDLEEFFLARYRPDRAAICAVGAVEPATMFKLLAAEFGSWKAHGPRPRPVVTEEGEQRGERRAVERMPTNPLVATGWPIPTWGHPDKAAVDVLSAVLGRGESSRLHTALVKEQQTAVYVGAFTEFPGERYANLLTVVAAPQAPHGPAAVEAGIQAEVARLQADGLTARELAKAVNLLEASIFQQLADNTNMAASIAGAQATLDDWRMPLYWVAEARALTTDALRDAARKYLTPDHRNVVTILPPDAVASAGVTGGGAGSTWEPPHPDG
jgi:predicted Zn-dependent peptidase